MERTFVTHRIRPSHDALPLWQMTTLDEGGLSAPIRVMVPGVWESVPALKNYHGRARYEQDVTCEGNVRIWLGGVSIRAKVWLDGQQVAAHYGAYTGFEAIVRGVSHGSHRLCIEADNRFGDDSALHVPNDYYAYGGVNRPVVIEDLGEAYINSLHVTPRLIDGLWHAMTEVTVTSLSDAAADYLLRLDAAGSTIEKTIRLASGATVRVMLDLPCHDAQVWSPASPVLTTIQATLAHSGTPVDDLIDRFGFREIRVEGNQILLNGQLLRLKGFNRHEEYGDLGVSVPVELMLRDLLMFKDLGANCVRTCHYPNDPRFLDLCDELGILVWEESHSRGLGEERMRHPLFMEQLEQCTREMVDQHFNHPSIFIWASLNECADDTDYGADCYRRIFRLLHELDASRPMTAALLERAGGKVFDASDVVSVNIYPQWYHDTPVAESLSRKIAEAKASGGEGKPMIVSEIGAGAIMGYHDPFGEAKWSEERQCTILRDQVEAVMADSDCIGVFLWQFADVRVDESWFAHRPRTYNNKGVVDEYRRPKLSYATVKELFHKF